MPWDSAEARIWYRASSSSEKTGPFPLAEVSAWYDRCQILPSSQFSIDGGASWISIFDLRRRNGPFLPLLAVGCVQKQIDDEKLRISRLEQEVETVLSEVGEAEQLLEKLREMEKILDPDSFTEIEKIRDQSEEASDRRMTEERAIIITRSIEGQTEICDTECFGPFDREEVMRVEENVRRALQNESDPHHIFQPIYFCPEEFLYIANREATDIDRMSRVLKRSENTDETLEDRLLRVFGTDSFVTLNEQDQKLIVDIVWLYGFRRKRFKLWEIKLPNKITCHLCILPFATPRLVMQHSVSSEHFEQLSIRPRPIDSRSYFQWNELIATAALDAKYEIEFHPRPMELPRQIGRPIVLRVRNVLNAKGKLKRTIFPAEGVNPFAILNPHLDGSEKMSDPVEIHTKWFFREYTHILEYGKTNKDDESKILNQLTEELFKGRGGLIDQVWCHLCPAFPGISVKTGSQLIHHITRVSHLDLLGEDETYGIDAFNFWRETLIVARESM